MTPTISAATPRSLEVLTEHARHVAPCGHCGAQPGKHCPVHGGQHLARFVRALVVREITVGEMAVIIGPLDVFSGRTIIRAGAR